MKEQSYKIVVERYSRKDFKSNKAWKNFINQIIPKHLQNKDFSMGIVEILYKIPTPKIM